MNFTALIEGTNISTQDDVVMQAIEGEPTDLKIIKMQRMRIGIRNEDGAIYRVIGVEGITEFLDLIDQLTGLNYIDELQEKSSARNGYDAIFKAR